MMQFSQHHTCSVSGRLKSRLPECWCRTQPCEKLYHALIKCTGSGVSPSVFNLGFSPALAIYLTSVPVPISNSVD